ncbi:trimethylamine methyltransferase family protein [Sporomusa sp.]|uniref:trimethylamine methyltransferase family protein n=1 Tax=Sporomusa sp. TaxID=2078658 RepID=UPI002C3A4D80|nr:trimethylamine methyltransferase family protein [Sporomusa sp.]HWR41730.1 trimethylamine methyltransferase family protein [Sporomusa sp.]
MWENGGSAGKQTGNTTVQFNVLADSQKERIWQAALEVLEQTGVEIYNEQAVNLLKKAGCHVDGRRVRIPPQAVEQALTTAPSRVVLADRYGNSRLFLEGKNTYFGPGPTNPYFYDVETGERRKVNKNDVMAVAKLVEDLPNMDFCMSLACISDVTPCLADLHEVQAMLLTTTKPFVTWAFNERNQQRIIEMCEVVAGSAEALRRNPFVVLYSEPVAPLKHPSESLGKMMYLAEKGLPAIYTPGVQGCATGPASLAGVLVVALADNMAGLVIHQLTKEGAPYIAGGVTTNMDMATMIHCYGSSPDFCVMQAAYTEIIQYLELPMFSAGGASDSKVLDEQAAIEYSLSIYSAALSGANLVHDVGFLESAMSSSLECLVMADEIISYVRKIVGGIRVDDETLAVDVINQVGCGGHFLAEEHTFKNFKREFWRPKIINRERYHTWEAGGKTTYKERLTQKARDMLASHQPKVLPAEVQRQIQAIIEQAEAEA